MADRSSDQGPVPLGQRDPVRKRLVLSPRRTLPTADAFVRELYAHPDGRRVLSYAGMLLEWCDNHYVEIEEESVKQKLQPWLHGALRYAKSGKMKILVPFNSNPSTVKAALDSIRTHVHLPVTVAPPAWLVDDPAGLPPADELLVGKSKILHLPTMGIIEPSPRLFVTSALGFDYDPHAPVPERWLVFLRELFPDDPEAVHLLQTWCGYLLTGDTRLQKMLLLVGPKRSGKGTIGRVLTHLIGPDNVCGPTISSLAGSFGLQPLIGKSLAIVSDARFAGRGVQTVTERLLCVSGEDALSVDRKYLGSITMKLPTRFMFLTNELPKLTETSGALAGRFIVIKLARSFYGHEDPGLIDKLLEELPGILSWAIEGWKMLKAEGRFVEPASSREEREALEDLLSPVGAFVREKCDVGPAYRETVQGLYQAWRQWCWDNGRDYPGTIQSFSRDLHAAVPGVKTRRNQEIGRFIEGIRLRPPGGYREVPQGTAVSDIIQRAERYGFELLETREKEAEEKAETLNSGTPVHRGTARQLGLGLES